MKVRSDFVTNSSSSSFVVVFKTKEEQTKGIDYIRTHFGEEYAVNFEGKLSAGKQTKEKVLKELATVFCYEAMSNIRRQCLTKSEFYGKYGMEYSQGNLKKAAMVEAQKYLDRFKGTLPARCSYYGIINYEDKTEMGVKMEQQICPTLPFVYKTINKH